MNTRFTCSTRGQCEADPGGRHASLVQCRQSCEPTPQRDLMLMILSNNLTDAARLAPSDREQVLLNLTRLRFPPERTRAILNGLAQQDVRPLLDYQALVEYAGRIWDPQVLRTALLNSGDWRALIYLEEIFHRLSVAEREQFARAALFNGDVQAITELYEAREHELLRSLAEVYLQPTISPEVLTVMFEYDGDHLSYYIPSAVRQDLQNFLQVALASGYTSREEIEEYRTPSPASVDDYYDEDDILDEYD